MAVKVQPAVPSAALVNRALKLSYAQAMLGAVFAASTGGMFLIGFAIALGANNVWLGLLASIPQLLVVAQFLASRAVERGWSRKSLTVVFSYVVPLGWLFVALIPPLAPRLAAPGRMALLITIMAAVSVAGQIAANARGSWIGELVPQNRRGRFFGLMAMFWGIVASVFAIIEGRFLDIVRSHGLAAFAALFFFGSVFGLASATLNHPQPDCPLPTSDTAATYIQLLRKTLRNKPLVRLAIAHAVIALASIAGPFSIAYCLRDVKVSFLGLGILNSVSMLAGLIASPFCGRLVDRVGCRPIAIIALTMLIPLSAIWLFIPPDHPHRAYMLLPWTNFIGGAAGACLNVGISTMIYKLTTPVGRSVQLAAYTSFVTVAAAPMPFLGGLLIHALTKAHYAVDLRLLFYIQTVFWLTGVVLFWRLHEPGSSSVRHTLRHVTGNRVQTLRV